MKQVMLKLAEKPTNTYFQPAELFLILPVYIFYNIGPSSSGKTRAFGARIPQVRILSAQLPYKLPLKLKKVAVFLLTRPTGFEPTKRPLNCENLEQFNGKADRTSALARSAPQREQTRCLRPSRRILSAPLNFS